MNLESGYLKISKPRWKRRRQHCLRSPESGSLHEEGDDSKSTPKRAATSRRPSGSRPSWSLQPLPEWASFSHGSFLLHSWGGRWERVLTAPRPWGQDTRAAFSRHLSHLEGPLPHSVAHLAGHKFSCLLQCTIGWCPAPTGELRKEGGRVEKQDLVDG